MSKGLFAEMNKGSVNPEDKYMAVINNKGYKGEHNNFFS